MATGDNASTYYFFEFLNSPNCGLCTQEVQSKVKLLENRKAVCNCDIFNLLYSLNTYIVNFIVWETDNVILLYDALKKPGIEFILVRC